ncbi:hypothetical protein [Streptomyces sp. NBC_01013]|nr:hypothetical protein OG538_26240 [Streptomyces sp. NBC_01013]
MRDGHLPDGRFSRRRLTGHDERRASSDEMRASWLREARGHARARPA